MSTSNSFDSLLAAGAAFANDVDPISTSRPSETTSQLRALEQLGYNIAAQRETLGDEALELGDSIPQNLSLEGQTALAQGMNQYYSDANAMYNADVIDYGQAALGGVAEGAFKLLATTGALGAGLMTDAQMAGYNAHQRARGGQEVAHNYTGEWTSAMADLGEGFGNWFRNAEQENLNRALAANRAARERALEQKYQQDRDNGMSSSEAGFRDFLRGVSSGVENFLDSPLNAVDTTAEMIGQLGVQGLIRQGAVKLAGETAKGALAQRLFDAGTLGATEAAGSIGESAKEIDSLTDDQLFKQSPVFKAYYQDNLLQGKSPEQAAKDARTQLKNKAALLEAGIGGTSALIAGGMTRPLEGLGAASPLREAIRGTAAEGIEEGLTGLGQGMGSNIAAQQTYNPSQRLMEGVGAQVGEGAIAGAMAAGILRSPGTAAYTVNQGIEQAKAGIQQAQEAKAQKATDTVTKGADALKTVKEANKPKQEETTNTTQSTVSVVNDEDPDASVDIPVTEITKADGTTKTVAADTAIADPETLTDDDLVSFGLAGSKEEAAQVQDPAVRDVTNQLNTLMQTAEKDPTAASNFTKLYEGYRDKLNKTTTFDQQVAEQKGLDTNEDPEAVMHKVMETALAGGDTMPQLPAKADPNVIEQAKLIWNMGKQFNTTYNRINKIKAREAKKTLKALDPENATPEQVTAVTEGLADGTVNPEDPKIKRTILKIKQKPKSALNDEEKNLLALDKLMSDLKNVKVVAADTEGITSVKNKFYGNSRDNVYTTLNTAIKNIYSGAAHKDEKRLLVGVTTFDRLAEIRANKLEALQRSLRNNTNEPTEYITYNSRTGEAYVEKINLGSPALYDQIKKEGQDLVTAFNNVINTLKEYYPYLDSPTLIELPVLENEAELMDAFRKKYGIKGLKSNKNKTPEKVTKASPTNTQEETLSKNAETSSTNKQEETPSTDSQSDVTEEADTSTPAEEVVQEEPSTSVSESVSEPVSKPRFNQINLLSPEAIVEREQKLREEEEETTPVSEKETVVVEEDSDAQNQESEETAAEEGTSAQENEEVAEEQNQEEDTRTIFEKELESKKDPEPEQGTTTEEKKEEKKEKEEKPKGFSERAKRLLKLAGTTVAQAFANRNQELKVLRDQSDVDTSFGKRFQEAVNDQEGPSRSYFLAKEQEFQKDHGMVFIRSLLRANGKSYYDYNEDTARIRATVFTSMKDKRAIDYLNGHDAYQVLLDKLRRFAGKADITKDIATINRFSKEIKDFFNNALSDKKSAENGYTNLGSFIKDSINKQNSAVYTALGVTYNPEVGVVDYSKASTDRLAALFTELNEKGEIVFNDKAMLSIAMSALQTMQNIEERIQVRNNDQVNDMLDSLGLDSSIMEKLTPEEQVAMRSGMLITSVVADMAHKFMDYSGVQNNRDISNTISGTSAAHSMATLAYQALEANGYLHTQMIYLKPVDTGKGRTTWVKISQAEYLKSKDPDLKALVLTVPTKAFKYSKDKSIKKRYDPALQPEVSFKNVSLIDSIESVFSHQPERTYYFDPKDMPPVSKHQLRNSNVPLTRAQKTATENRREVAHYVDEDMLETYLNVLEAGMIELNNVHTDRDATLEVTASQEGKELSITRDFNTAVQRGIAAILHNPENPVLYGDHTVHKGGRAQELTPNGDQASKIFRYMASNVRSPIDIKDPAKRLSFQRAFLQAFGVKVKKKTDQQIEETFNKVHQAFVDVYGNNDFKVSDISKGIEGVSKAFEVVKEAIGEKPENVPIGISATINMMRYCAAVRTGTSFMNTLPLEYDGSCNGFAMSHFLFDGENEITLLHIQALAKSNIYLGYSDATTPEMDALIGQDNYTANAVAASAKLNELIQGIASNNKKLGDKVQTDGIGEKELLLSLFYLFGQVSQGDIQVNETALNEAFNRDAVLGSDAPNGALLNLARNAVKNPTTRINYGQGQGTNATEIWGDFSVDLATKLSEILQNPTVAPYKVFYAKQLASGKLNDSQAYNNFKRIGEVFNMLNMYSYAEGDTGAHITKAKSNPSERILPLFSLAQDETLEKHTELMDTIREFSFRDPANYNEQLINNIQRYYADPMYNAINDSRSEAYTQFTKTLTTTSGVIAMMANQLLVDLIKDFRNTHQGLLPSDNDMAEFNRQVAILFPTVIHMRLSNLSIAGSQTIDVATGDNSYRINSRNLSGAKVKRGLFRGSSVIAKIHSALEQRIPFRSGVAPVASIVIAAGDGDMQTRIFNNKKRHPSDVDRYDGVDTDPINSDNAAQYINEAVYNLQFNFPIEAVYDNFKKFKDNIDKLEVSLGEEALANYLHNAFMAVDPEYKGKHRKSEEIPSLEELKTILQEQEDTLKELKRNAFINAVTRLSMPMSMHHMSTGPKGYNRRHRNDTFEVPRDIPVQLQEEIIRIEANRRRAIVEAKYEEIYKEWKETGKVKIPSEIYKTIPKYEVGIPTNLDEQEQLVLAKTDTFIRAVPNTNALVEANAPLHGDNRGKVKVQTNAAISTNLGRISDRLHSTINEYIKKNPTFGYNQTGKDAGKFLKNFINMNMPEQTRVVFTSPKVMAKKGVGNDVPAFYDVGDDTIYIIKNKMTEDPTVLVHELVHAMTAAKIYDLMHKNDPLIDVLRGLKTNTERLMSEEDPELFEDYKNRVLESPSEEIQLNEFIAYMLTDPDFIQFAIYRKPDESLSAKLVNLYKRFRNFLMKFLGLRSVEDLVTAYSLYEHIGEVSNIIAAVDTEINPDITDEVLKFTAKSQDTSLQNFNARIQHVLANLALKSEDPARFKTDADIRAQNIQEEILTKFQQSWFPMSLERLAVASQLAALYSAAYKLNSSVKLDALNLRNQVVDKLKPEHFALPQDGSDTLPSQLRYDFFVGNESITSNDEDMNLGVFMAMATLSPEFRQVLNKTGLRIKPKDLGVQKVINVSDSPVDEFFTNTAYSALEVFNDPLLLGSTDKAVVNVLDDLNDQLLVVKKNETILNKYASFMAKADESVSNWVDNKITQLIDSGAITGMIKSDSKFAHYLGQVLQVSVPFLTKADNQYFKDNIDEVRRAINIRANESVPFFRGFFTTAMRELMAADDNANTVYGMEKKAKAIVQTARANWREVAPRTIREQFREEGVQLTEKISSSLNKTILTSDIGTLPNDLIKSVMNGNLNQEINKRAGKLSEIGYKRAKELAKYMITGQASNGMLRNADAIAIFAEHNADKVELIDELVTLLVLQQQKEDLQATRAIYKQAPKAFEYVVNQQRELRQQEREKLTPITLYNYYKGYYPQDIMTKTNVQVVPLERIKHYNSLGYSVKGYTRDGMYAYMQSSLNPLSTFNQGGLQSIINQSGGIDELTGFSPNSRVYRRIKQKDLVKKITKSLEKRQNTREVYIPILDSIGSKIIGYEVTVDPSQYKEVVKQTDFAENIGAWKGRQVEEDLAQGLNEELINETKRQWEEAKGTKNEKEFVDLVALGRRDPIIRDALRDLSPKTLMLLSGSTQLPDQWMVRQDLIPDIIGRRQASVVDLKTGISYWSPDAQKTFVDVAEKIMGKRAMAYLYRGEIALKSLTASIRNFIVIRSGEVMFNNILGNVISLSIRGVPLFEIMRATPKIVKELENYNLSRKRQIRLEMALNAERGRDKPSKYRIRQLETKLKSEKALINQLSYSKDLLEAGEYNTIADIGDVNDDLLLSTGKYGEYLENQVKKLPSALEEAGRQLVLTKDTAIYRALEKGTMYGDFVAKAILYKHLTEKKKMKPKDALSKVRYEFVNYDMLPGRTREYLENMGVLWFYNYKLRITRTMMSMIKENPVSALISLASPISLGIGTPITDNFLVKLFTNPFGSVGFKLFDLPWFTNHLWYNLAS